MSQVRSKDGTTIGYERSGGGPPLILVDGALCSRAFGPSKGLAARLASRFTVYAYDRRGRGQSGDASSSSYAADREVEDIAALVEAAGGSAALLGLSSGGALALHAAAAGVPAVGVVAYEPPYVDEGGPGGAPHEDRLKDLLASGKRGAAVRYFMKDMVGAPAVVVVMMRLMPWIWRKLEAVAHTLPYDAAVMTGFRVPRDRFASIGVPALVMNGSKTDARLRDAALATTAAVPGARHQELPGQSHNVSADVLVPPVVDFLSSRS
jgi:pimeloyl-ACP methyl ester carboxylesterase